MNQLISSKKETMSSREIAELTGKNHHDVLRAIRTMESAWEKITESKFAFSEYKDSTGRTLPMYELSKTECLYVATKFNDTARAKLVIRWEELEINNSQFQIPQSYSDALRLAAEQAERIEKQQLQIESERPKVLFADAVIGAKTSCLIGELAKYITQKGFNIGEKRLFSWMRENKYLGKRGETYNIPLQKHVEQGLFELKKGTRSGNS